MHLQSKACAYSLYNCIYSRYHSSFIAVSQSEKYRFSHFCSYKVSVKHTLSSFCYSFFLCSPQWYLSPFISFIPLPSLPLSIEWLKLRSALTTIPVPQPMTSNPQPQPYRIFPIIHFFSGRATKVDMFPYKKTELFTRLL